MKIIKWINFVLVVTISLGFALSNVSGSIAGDNVELVKSDKVKGSFIGIYPADIDDNDREALDFEGDGILIEDIVKDGPSDKAGLEAGDIMIVLDGDKVSSVIELRQILAKRNPDDKIKVQVIRDGKKEKFKIVLGEKPASMFASMEEVEHKITFLGVETEELEGQLAEYFGVKTGVLVNEVVGESAAEKAGLKAGDVIMMIDGHEIIDPGDLGEFIRAQKTEQEVTILVKRDRKVVEIKAVLGEKTYTTSRRGFGNRNFNIDIDLDDEHLRLNHESIQKLIERALGNIELEIGEEEVEEFHEEMMKVRKEFKELKKELHQMKEDLEKSRK